MVSLKRAVLACTCTLLLGITACWAQYKPAAGTFSNGIPTRGQPRFQLKVKAGASGNFEVSGFLVTYYSDGRRRDSMEIKGTLYKTGTLKARIVSPAKFASTWTLDGTFDTKTGLLKLALKHPQKYESGTRSGYYIKNFSLRDANSKPDIEVVWVLKNGFPTYDATYLQAARPFSVYGNGTMTWPATSLKDGKPISQSFSFTVPKNEYKHGEKYTVTIDGSGTEKGAYPYVVCMMYYGWRPGGWTGMGNDNSQYNISVGFKASGEVTFDPRSEAEAAILVGASGMGGMRWEYKRVERVRK